MEYTIEAMGRMIDGMSTATKFGFIEAVIEVLPIYDTYRMITCLKCEYTVCNMRTAVYFGESSTL